VPQPYLRAIIGAVCLGVASAAAAQQTLSPIFLSIVDNVLLDDATGAPPGPAAAVGYDTETFHSTTLGSTSGTWQPFTFFHYTQMTGSAMQVGSSMVLTNSHSSNAGVSTAAECGTSWCGVAFGGGLYTQATFSFTGTQPGVGGWPAFWMMAIEHLAPLTASEQWPGQTSGYWNYNEFDVMEADTTPSTTYGAASHNHYGNVSEAAPNGQDAVSPHNVNYPGGNANVSHIYGFLWVPATSTSQGYANYYLDGALVARDTWNLFSSANSPPPCVSANHPTDCTSGGTAFSFGDSQHYALVLGTAGTSFTMTVTDVQVWQMSAAGKLVQ
jgi:hypothetical protein